MRQHEDRHPFPNHPGFPVARRPGLLGVLPATSTATTPASPTKPATITASLPTDLIALEPSQAESSGRTTVILIGENHANVKSQADLYTILGKLHQAGMLDAILVEGSKRADRPQGILREI